MRSLHVIIISAMATSAVLLASDARAHPAWGIVADRQGQIYFSDLETIWKIDAEGRLSVFRAGERGRHTHDLNIDEAGNLYGAENTYEPSTQRFLSAIWKMTPAGNFSYLLASTDRPPQGTSIWKDREGNTFHAANYPERELLVLKRTPSGNTVVLAGNARAARQYRQTIPYSLGGMAFAADGSLYLTDRTGIHKVTTAGAFTTLVRRIADESAAGNSSPREGAGVSLLGLAVDGQGNILAADLGNRRVLRITPDGRASTLLRAETSWLPTGVAARDADIYILEVAETTSHAGIRTRVRRLSPDGRISVLAATGENHVPAALQSSPDEKAEPEVEPRRNALYPLLGAAAAGVVALSFIFWRVGKRRISHHQT